MALQAFLRTPGNVPPAPHRRDPSWNSSNLPAASPRAAEWIRLHHKAGGYSIRDPVGWGSTTLQIGSDLENQDGDSGTGDNLAEAENVTVFLNVVPEPGTGTVARNGYGPDGSVSTRAGPSSAQLIPPLHSLPTLPRRLDHTRTMPTGSLAALSRGTRSILAEAEWDLLTAKIVSPAATSGSSCRSASRSRYQSLTPIQSLSLDTWKHRWPRASNKYTPCPAPIGATHIIRILQCEGCGGSMR